MFNGRRLKQAREILGLTQAQLADAIRIDQSSISLLEQNAREPSAETAQLIYLATGFPKSYFERSDGPDFPEGSLLFRKRAGVTSADAAAIRQSARLLLEVFLALEARFKPILMRIPQAGDADPVSAARLARSALGYSPDGPIKALMSRLEKAGVLIARLPIDGEGFDAFSAWSAEKEQRPIIALGRGVAGDRDRATLSHELCHLVMHSGFMGTLSQIEDDATLFAGEFLLPEADIINWASASDQLTLTALAELKSRWGVSMQFILQRLEILKLISPQQKSYWRGKMRREGWLENEPVPIAPESPRLLRQMVESAHGVPIDIRKVARTYSLPPKLLRQYLEVNGGQVGRDGDGQDEVGADRRRNELASVLKFNDHKGVRDGRVAPNGEPEPYWPSKGR